MCAFPAPLSQARESSAGLHSEPAGSTTCWETWSQRKPQIKGNWIIHLPLFKLSPPPPLYPHSFRWPVTSRLFLAMCHPPHNSLLENSKIQTDRHTHQRVIKVIGCSGRCAYTCAHLCTHMHTRGHTDTYAHERLSVIPSMRADQERRGLNFILQVRGSH